MEENPETEQENYNKSEMMHNNEISNIQYQEEDVTENNKQNPIKNLLKMKKILLKTKEN